MSRNKIVFENGRNDFLSKLKPLMHCNTDRLYIMIKTGI